MLSRRHRRAPRPLRRIPASRPRERQAARAARRRLAAITSGGAIPDNALFTVVAEPEGTVVGTVDEDFAVESNAGDIMLLGNTSWRIRRVESSSRPRAGAKTRTARRRVFPSGAAKRRRAPRSSRHHVADRCGRTVSDLLGDTSSRSDSVAAQSASRRRGRVAERRMRARRFRRRAG